MKTPDIKYLFKPRSIAVVGASHNPQKIGHEIVSNIKKGNYQGKVYPVNPKGGTILEYPVYRNLREIEDEVDMVVISVPAKFVFNVVQEAAEVKAKFLLVITSGFSEIGNLAEEQRIVEYAREHGMRVLGPNIFGIYSKDASLNATFGPSDIHPGNVAIITQSGALGIAMIGKTKVLNMGLSAIVSVGNKSDIDEGALLEYLKDNESTKAILMYIEGIKKGEHLISVFEEAALKKPVIVIKSGRSKRGAMAAASHTGSLAGADEVFSDIMKQCGVIRAETIEQALDWCKFLSQSPLPEGKDSVIITNGGGIGVMAADACEKYGVELYSNQEVLRATFKEVIPEFGSYKNPVDITGQAGIKEYEKSMEKAVKSEDIHSIICLGCETASLTGEVLTDSVRKMYNKYKDEKPIVFSFFGGESIEKSISTLRQEGIPMFSELYDAVMSLGILYKHYKILKRAKVDYSSLKEYESLIDLEEIRNIVKSALAAKRTFLLPHEAQKVMSCAGVATPKTKIAKNLEQALKYAREIGYPVVLKIASKDIIHKSDAGGVALDLENDKELIDAYEAIMYNVRRYKKDAVISGVEVSEMIKGGIETIVGARKDKIFGPIVMFGLGGIYVEIMKDVAFRAFPLIKEEAFEMIKSIKSYPLLLGVRGESKKDIPAIVDTIIKAGYIIKNIKEISDIEINPLSAFSYGEGAKAVDIRILLNDNNGEKR